jgi:hypothetical protein
MLTRVKRPRQFKEAAASGATRAAVQIDRTNLKLQLLTKGRNWKLESDNPNFLRWPLEQMSLVQVFASF